jgi:hypothetical protein
MEGPQVPPSLVEREEFQIPEIPEVKRKEPNQIERISQRLDADN